MGEQFRFHVGPFDMDPLRVTVIAAFEQDGVAPEGGDLFLMRVPFVNMLVENGAQHRVLAYAGVKGVDLRVDLFRRCREARSQDGSGHNGTNLGSVLGQYLVLMLGDRSGFVARLGCQQVP